MAETTTVRITRQTHAALTELAAKAGVSTQRFLDDLVEQERRRRFFDEADAAFRALREDPDAWAEELAERALWDQTLAEGWRTTSEAATTPRRGLAGSARPRGRA